MLFGPKSEITGKWIGSICGNIRPCLNHLNSITGLDGLASHGVMGPESYEVPSGLTSVKLVPETSSWTHQAWGRPCPATCRGWLVILREKGSMCRWMTFRMYVLYSPYNLIRKVGDGHFGTFVSALHSSDFKKRIFMGHYAFVRAQGLVAKRSEPLCVVRGL